MREISFNPLIWFYSTSYDEVFVDAARSYRECPPHPPPPPPPPKLHIFYDFQGSAKKKEMEKYLKSNV